MLTTNANGTRKGDCEASHFDGRGVNVDLRLVHGNMWLCAECILAEQKAEEEARIKALKEIPQFKPPMLPELKQDVFTAGTVPFVEIYDAVMHNDSIPADKKWSSIVEKADALYQTLSAAIFAEEAALVEKKNARHAMHISIQQAVNKLRVEERAKYAEYNTNYKVPTITKAEKSTKPVKPATNKAGDYKKDELFEAAKKYNVPASRVRIVMRSKNISAENAAKLLAEAMGLL